MGNNGISNADGGDKLLHIKVNDGYFGTKISGYVPQVFLNGDAYLLKTYISDVIGVLPFLQ
jgi:hypothetical protein